MGSIKIKRKIKDNLLNYSFVLPVMIFFYTFIIYSTFKVFYYSLFKGRLYDAVFDEFIGLENYIKIFRDPILWEVIKNTFIYVIGVVLVKIIIGLLLALLLYKNTITNKINRIFIFIPIAMSAISTSLVWSAIYNPRYGLLNNILEFLHMDFLTNLWLGNPKIAMFCIIAIDAWHGIGFVMVLLIAGIQNIAPSIYEAGRVDGTNKLTENIYITIPLIKKVLITVTLFIIASAFKTFEYIFATTQGGPFNKTHVLGTYMFYIGFKRGADFTQGAAIGVVLFFLSVILSGTFLYFSKFTKES